MRKQLTLLLCFLLIVAQLWAQNKTITGKVVDADRKPIQGASITVRGSKSGSITDGAGNFKISISADAKVLVISSVGQITQELRIGSQTDYSIQMAPAEKSLDEVVVVGYQAIKRKDLNGATSVIGSKEIAQRPMQNFTQILQGKAPGLQVVGSSGQPGAAGFMRIRGTGSINASNEPLVMIDGIAVTPAAFSLLNPNDIENISVLKDASSAAIYGSRASNGVIVVTTKNGKPGAAQVKYSYQRGFVSLQELKNVRLMSGLEKLKWEYEVGLSNPIIDSMILNRRGSSLPATATLANITDAQRQSLWDLMMSRAPGNWLDYYLQPGKTTSHEVSISGATEKMKYYFSVNTFNEDGIVYKNFRDRIGARLNAEYKATNWLTTGVNVSTAYAKEYQTRELFNSQAPWTAYFLTNPYEPVYLPNGSYNFTMQGFSALEGQDKNTFFNNNLSTFATGFLEAKVNKHLNLKSVVALNYNTNLSENYLQPGSNLAAILGFNQKSDGGFQDFQYVVTNTANWIQSFGEKHNFNVLAGQEFTKRKLYTYTVGARGFPTPSVTTLDNAATAQIATTFRSEFSIISYFSSIGYDFDKKYGVKLSARRDGSSRFGANNRFSNFWAASAWWNAKNEKFMDNISFLSDLKVRASYGTAGNVPNDLYGSLGTYALNVAYNNAPAAAPAQIANPDLTWEKNTNWDLGIDFGLFDNRITGTVDYYNRKTNDLLFPQPLSQTTGFNSVLSNIGSITNKGVEVSITGEIIRKKDLKWSVTVAYTNNDNKVNSLISDNIPSTNNTRLVIGQPLNTYHMVRWAGINPANGRNQYYATDGSITETYSLSNAVLQNGKSPLAKYFGNINSNLTFKNFDFSLQFYYTGGNYIYNAAYQNNIADGGNAAVGLRPQFTAAGNYWRKAGDIATAPNVTEAGQKQNFTTDRYLEKGDYISLRDMMIGYTLPTEIAKTLKLAGLRFYVQGTNLFIGTKFHGLPEVGIINREAAAPAQPGILSLYAYPNTRTITVGVDVKF